MYVLERKARRINQQLQSVSNESEIDRSNFGIHAIPVPKYHKLSFDTCEITVGWTDCQHQNLLMITRIRTKNTIVRYDTSAMALLNDFYIVFKAS
ncbi:hypothetical protein AAMO2058_000239400 [Amorphochlora amoebiformis]